MPIIDQLTQALHDVDEAHLYCLRSTDEDGYAVRTTTERLSCNKLRIAVPPSTAEFNFPFQVAQKWGIGTPVCLGRHTKIRKRSIPWQSGLSFRGQNTRAVVMTGSGERDQAGTLHYK